jgi:hypothetical protein
MHQSQIVMGINARVASTGTPYGDWGIGLTHNSEARKTQLRVAEAKDTDRWTQWQVDSLADGQSIESYFIKDKGMRSGTRVDLYAGKPLFVYIY